LKTIEITVDSKGECTVQTKGFAGSSCREASKFVEKALGVVVSDAPTAEMYQSAVENVTLFQRDA
jgi:Protein of unknown function (DUF2997)